MELDELQPGDHVYTVHQSYADSVDFIGLTVVRVGKKFVTVQDRHGDVYRFEPRHLAGRITDAEWADW
jgi:hypothetical protein